VKIRLVVTTPPGEAEKALPRIKKAFKVHKTVGTTAYTNEAGDRCYIEVEGDPRRCAQVQRKAAGFSVVLQRVAQSKHIKRKASQLSESDRLIWENMINEGTSVEVLTEATAAELLDDKSMWKRVKERVVLGYNY